MTQNDFYSYLVDIILAMIQINNELFGNVGVLLLGFVFKLTDNHSETRFSRTFLIL